MMSEPMMPMGMSRFGLRVSSAAVETAAKPMYEKKISAAPARTPVPAVGEERREVVQVAVPEADTDEQDEDRDLDRHHDVVEDGALLHPDDQDPGDERDDRDRGDVHHDRVAEQVRGLGDDLRGLGGGLVIDGEPVGDAHAERALQDVVEV